MPSPCCGSVMPDFYAVPYSRTDPQEYRCSTCEEVFVWGDESSYWGSIECKKCGWAKVDWVSCSKECAEEPLAKKKVVEA